MNNIKIKNSDEQKIGAKSLEDEQRVNVVNSEDEQRINVKNQDEQRVDVKNQDEQKINMGSPEEVLVVNGKSAYKVAVENGFEGTEQEWLESLHGEKGEKGERGEKGEKGDSGTRFVTDETLSLENGVLSVNIADEVDDKTLPISAAAVNTTVGNIEVLLATI